MQHLPCEEREPPRGQCAAPVRDCRGNKAQQPEIIVGWKVDPFQSAGEAPPMFRRYPLVDRQRGKQDALRVPERDGRARVGDIREGRLERLAGGPQEDSWDS